MTLLIKHLPSGRIPGGMVKVHWLLRNKHSIETVEVDDVDRIRGSQFVVPGNRVYDVTSVERSNDALVAHCWPATT